MNLLVNLVNLFLRLLTNTVRHLSVSLQVGEGEGVQVIEKNCETLKFASLIIAVVREYLCWGLPQISL